ncbi:ABC transporter ATP-binding protein [Lederbergia panacisoli]|uniref:ABC transporter ATP-binding protein n=1 Tax=Lederbergia panacisoli TaxID=1255251 RepID=UPI00214AA97A|nr:dipeptide ABC transporter ATP-binding protein [Lederbergia panacisoli]MCR2820074.1 dipeptide ABC transporter ATP-binding protein [Lederbergia panacisoli]
MQPLLEVKDLKKYFPITKGLLGRATGYVKAVESINFTLLEGETLGIVGESGSGKSTLGRTIMRLLDPTEGSIIFQGQDISHLSRQKLRSSRKNMQMVFQDPYSSLNQRMTIGQLLDEPLSIHTNESRKNRMEKVAELLEIVGLNPEVIHRYPHEFSGGQRQRIGIARALAINPKLIIADEPVSALDVSIQSQIINLLMDLQEKFQLSYLFIAHDLSVVKHISDRIGVMYMGQMMELAPKNELFHEPLHPYTQSLLSAIPKMDPEAKRERILLKGDLPDAANLPNGCPFHTRCPMATSICKEIKPAYQELKAGHYVACHLYDAKYKEQFAE